MAGNPFRRGESLSYDVIPKREAAPELRVDTSGSQTQTQIPTQAKSKFKGKVQKKVRIVSPIISPDTPANQGHDPFELHLNPTGQPRPPSPVNQDLDVARELRKSFIDSVARGASNLNKETLGSGQHPVDVTMELPRPSISSAPPARPGQQAPYNPFARTLASMESQHAPAANTTPSPLGLSMEDSSATSKPGMDVDAFTRMLLTGRAATSAPSPSPSTLVSTGGNSLGDLHPESPSASDDDDHDDRDDDSHEQEQDREQGQDQFGLVDVPDITQPKKPKPPPPAHHHGKMFSRKGPQTVSFAEFDSAVPPRPLSLSSPRPVLSRSTSDLNKPLPPPPVQQSPSPATSPALPDRSDDVGSPQIGDEMPQSRKPPPPPISRRHSQIRPRSSSSLSKSSIAEEDVDEPSAPASKPPPPPSRRAVNSASTTDSTPGSGAQTPTGRAPPPPPSRNTLKKPPAPSRTPSAQSTSSIGQHRTSPSIAQVPPPPPPRRSEGKRQSIDGTFLGPSNGGSRRPSDASHRGSLEMRRSSGASLYSSGMRTPSVSSVHTVNETDPMQNTTVTSTHLETTNEEDGALPSGDPDILADMSALQREIDDLVAKAKGGT